MTARINWPAVAPDALKALVALEGHVRKASGLSRTLLDLVYLRVSQINGCAYCVDIHSHDLREHGETEQRISLVAAFDEAEDVFDDKERAAMAWAESVTLLSESHVPDSVFERVKRHFDDHELAELTVAVATINAWNRIGATFRLHVKKR